MAILDTTSGLLLPIPPADAPGGLGQGAARPGQDSDGDTRPSGQFGEILQSIAGQSAQGAEGATFSIGIPRYQQGPPQAVNLRLLSQTQPDAPSATGAAVPQSPAQDVAAAALPQSPAQDAEAIPAAGDAEISSAAIQSSPQAGNSPVVAQSVDAAETLSSSPTRARPEAAAAAAARRNLPTAELQIRASLADGITPRPLPDALTVAAAGGAAESARQSGSEAADGVTRRPVPDGQTQSSPAVNRPAEPDPRELRIAELQRMAPAPAGRSDTNAAAAMTASPEAAPDTAARAAQAAAATLSPQIAKTGDRRLIGETARSETATPSQAQGETGRPNATPQRPVPPTAADFITRKGPATQAQGPLSAESARPGPAHSDLAQELRALLQGEGRSAPAGPTPAAASGSGGFERAASAASLDLAPIGGNAASSGGQSPQSSMSATAAATSPAPQQAAQHPVPPAMQVGLSIGKAAAEGRQHFTLRLDPPELGRIDVKLEMGGDGNLKAMIRADSRETLDLLQRDARHLERALTDAGLKTDSGSLNFSLNQQGQNGGLGFSHQGDPSPEGRDTPGAGEGEGMSESEADETEDGASLAFTAAESDSIDIRV